MPETPVAEQDARTKVVNERMGEVLLPNTILKSDHFPGCQNSSLKPLLDGAPNFRKVPGLPVYGVAMPTAQGLRAVLDQVGAGHGRRKVLWHNMREEPVLFVNGKPFVVREAGNPFANLEYTGITRTRVEDMENRLKADVLLEANEHGGRVLVASESDDFQVVDLWESAGEEDVQTTLELVAELIREGYDVDYVRVPVTDEKAPKSADCDALIGRVWDAPQQAALVFNCQMGRGRTTTGMIIASLLQLHRRELFPMPQAGDDPVAPDLEWWHHPPPPDPSMYPSQEAHLLKGNYTAVRSLLRVLPHGAESKAALDAVVDACSAMQNLREAICRYRGRIASEVKETKRQELLGVCSEYLERYYILIGFSSYLSSPHFAPNDSLTTTPSHRIPSGDGGGSPVASAGADANASHLSFSLWMQEQPELKSVLQRLLRRNPLAALELNTRQVPLSPGSRRGEGDGNADEVEAERMQATIAQRSGDVLNSGTILKADHFPSLPSKELPQTIAGAPNFRRAAFHPVYGVAIPTAEGIRDVLQAVGCGEGSHKRCVWHNLREELTVYINGHPYVMRESARPYKNMQEYDGITVARLEEMEGRLKADVWREAQAHGGRVLLMKEQEGEGGGPFLELVWDTLSGPDAVQTPRDVYGAVTGGRVSYHRIPITDGTSPTADDLDALVAHIRAESPEAPLVFNCQRGFGRSTVGMAVGCLLCSEGGRGGSSEAQSSPRTEAGKLAEGDSAGGAGGSDSEDDGEDDPEALLPTWGWRNENDDPEVTSAKKGSYVAVRRLVRLLRNGEAAKEATDNAINACAQLTNLRTVISKYRRPRGFSRAYQPEIGVRQATFKVGIAYLSRYLMLLAFTGYLRDPAGPGRFSDWVNEQDALVNLWASVRSNPRKALDVVVAHSPVVVPLSGPLESAQADLESQHAVMAARGGATLTKRTILKSFHAPRMFNPGGTNNIVGISDLRRAKQLPVVTTGNPSVDGLKVLLAQMGAGPEGRAHVCVTDNREEAVAYIGGSPYMRRDLDMPAANTHHAGMRWKQLQEVEAQLAAEVSAEAARCQGHILIHREVPPLRAEGTPARRRIRAHLSAHLDSPVKGGEAAPVLAPFAEGPEPAGGGEGEELGASHCDPLPLVYVEERDGRRDTWSQDGPKLAALWQDAGTPGDLMGVVDPAAVFRALSQDMGYSITYRRIPLSRERTPQAADVDDIAAQAGTVLPPGREQLVHLVISRTATGSSVRFVSALLCMYMRWQGVRDTQMQGVVLRTRRYRRTAEPVTTVDNKTIDNLCRSLPGGMAARHDVDLAVAACTDIGCMTDDIVSCQRQLEMLSEEDVSTHQLAAPRLGLHYLKRYFFLIAFRVYMNEVGEEGISGGHKAFKDWIMEREELHHLLTTMSLTN